MIPDTKAKLTAARSIRETRILFVGGVGNFTINHLLNTGIQFDRRAISEFIIKTDVAVRKYGIRNLQSGIVNIPGLLNYSNGLTKNDMNSIKWFCKTHPILSQWYYPNLVFLLIPATDSIIKNSNSNLSKSLRRLNKLDLVDRRNPNVVAILLFSCSISYKDVDRWEKTMKKKKQIVQAVILQVLEVFAPVVLLENDYGMNGHNLDVFGDFTRLPNGVLQPKNVYKACKEILRKNNDKLGLITLNTIFNKRNKMDTFRGHVARDSFSDFSDFNRQHETAGGGK